jgi:hypothetical protein
MLKGAYVAIGSIMLTFGVIMIVTLTNQAPQLNSSLTQIARIAGQNQGTQILLWGQKLSPMLSLAGAMFLGHGIKAKR